MAPWKEGGVVGDYPNFADSNVDSCPCMKAFQLLGLSDVLEV